LCPVFNLTKSVAGVIFPLTICISSAFFIFEKGFTALPSLVSKYAFASLSLKNNFFKLVVLPACSVTIL